MVKKVTLTNSVTKDSIVIDSKMVIISLMKLTGIHLA